MFNAQTEGKSKRRRLRELIAAPDITVMPGVYDGLSVEKLGFPAGNITGAGLSDTLLGRPDVGLLGPDAILRSCAMMARDHVYPAAGRR